ncbi:MAG: hypothetical protein K9L62_00415 [Vallitaleaceae bacterium]|nr:hypothetical protein [Vallitaleaceae bacterium]
MKLIKIINGTYGYRPTGSKHIEPKQAGDPPFEVEDSKAERLVSLGVAAYVDNPVKTVDTTKKEDVNGVATAIKGNNGQSTGVNPPKEDNSSNGAESTQDIPEYNADMKAAELREIMEECGLTYKVGMSKADMVDALDAYFEEEAENTEKTSDPGNEAEDAETPPDFGAEDTVV